MLAGLPAGRAARRAERDNELLNALNILLPIAWAACIIHVQYVYMYMHVCVCVRADSSSVSCGFSTESLRKSYMHYIWPVMSVIKSKRFWFLLDKYNNNNNKNI